MAAAKLVLEPVFEARFTDASFGFRPGRSEIDVCEAVRVAVNQRQDWVFEADIRDCFGTIDHDALMAQVARRVVGRQMLELIRAWLRMGVLEGGVTFPTGAGTPQGSPISPLLANVALHVLDEAWQTRGRRPGTLVRYCDDLVVLSPTGQHAEQGREPAAVVLGGFGMRLHPEKSGIVCLTRGGQGFDSLLHLWADHSARGLPSARERARGDGACQPVNGVGKPCAGELHARFEAAGTGNGASATAPVPGPAEPGSPGAGQCCRSSL